MPGLFQRILVPHDFSKAATAALKVAADLAKRNGGEVTVLHAMLPMYSAGSFVDGSELPSWVPPRELVAEARGRLERLSARALRGRRVRISCRVLVGDPYRCIVEAARQADSIVMSTLGRSGLSHLLIGSVAEKVVRHAPVPVLTIRRVGRGGRPAVRGQRGPRGATAVGRRTARAGRRLRRA